MLLVPQKRDEMQGAEKELNFFSNDPLSRVVSWQSRDPFSTILVPSWLCEPRLVIKPFSTPVTLCVKGEAGFNCAIIYMMIRLKLSPISLLLKYHTNHKKILHFIIQWVHLCVEEVSTPTVLARCISDTPTDGEEGKGKKKCFFFTFCFMSLEENQQGENRLFKIILLSSYFYLF